MSTHNESADSKLPLTVPVEFTSGSPGETFELGRKIGEQIQEKAVFLLSGDLGAGKTVFTKGLAEGLGIDPEEVTSPSFTLINIYDGRLRLYHVDLYRIETGDWFDLGLEEMLEEKRAVVVIEWGERLGTGIEGAYHDDIAYGQGEERTVRITGS